MRTSRSFLVPSLLLPCSLLLLCGAARAAPFNVSNDTTEGPTVTISGLATVDGKDQRALLEGNPGNPGNAGYTQFNVTLSVPSVATVTVKYATADGTATSGVDFVAGSGTLTFAPGVTSQSLTVQIKGDITPEPTETYFVRLNNPKFAVIADSQGVAYIKNDDGAAASSESSL